jgi:hypothetical protein
VKIGQFYTGLLDPPEGFVSAFPRLSSAITLLTDAEIQDIISDPNRTPDEQIFPDYFIREGDQEQHSSCAGWALANMFSETAFLNGDRKPDGTGEIYSGTYPYSGCNRGQDAGSVTEEIMNWCINQGMVPKSVCGVDNIWRQNTKQFDALAKQQRGLVVHTISSAAEFNTALARRQIVACVVNVDRSQYVNYRGVGLVPAFTGSGNHAIRCRNVRWNAAAGCYEYKQAGNWGLSWGLNGTGWCRWNSFSQTIVKHVFYTVTYTAKFS